MLNNITRDEVPRIGRKRLADSDRQTITNFPIGADYWQQSYQSTNAFIHQKNYGQQNQNFKGDRCPIKKQISQIDFDYSKNYQRTDPGINKYISEKKDNFGPKDLKKACRQPMYSYHELMKVNYDLGQTKREMHSTQHLHFDDKTKLKPNNIKYQTKHLTNYDIITNNNKCQQNIPKENTFERFHPDKKVSRISNNQDHPHQNFVMNDIVANRQLPYIRPSLLKQLKSPPN